VTLLPVQLFAAALQYVPAVHPNAASTPDPVQIFPAAILAFFIWHAPAPLHRSVVPVFVQKLVQLVHWSVHSF
jgi:hypothetical protein